MDTPPCCIVSLPGHVQQTQTHFSVECEFLQTLSSYAAVVVLAPSTGKVLSYSASQPGQGEGTSQMQNTLVSTLEVW